MFGGLLAGAAASGFILSSAAPARALVPYVLVPSPANLEGAGLGIAQAAARLLRLGQADDAARLAALEDHGRPRWPLVVAVRVGAQG